MTNTRELRLLAFGALSVWGFLRRRSDFARNATLTVGLGGILREAYAVAEERQLFAHPQLMNGYFKTGGELSAVRGLRDVAALKGTQ